MGRSAENETGSLIKYAVLNCFYMMNTSATKIGFTPKGFTRAMDFLIFKLSSDFYDEILEEKDINLIFVN